MAVSAVCCMMKLVVQGMLPSCTVILQMWCAHLQIVDVLSGTCVFLTVAAGAPNKRILAFTSTILIGLVVSFSCCLQRLSKRAFRLSTWLMAISPSQINWQCTWSLLGSRLGALRARPGRFPVGLFPVVGYLSWDRPGHACAMLHGIPQERIFESSTLALGTLCTSIVQACRGCYPFKRESILWALTPSGGQTSKGQKLQSPKSCRGVVSGGRHRTSL